MIRFISALVLALCFSAPARADVVRGSYTGSSRTTVNYLDPNTFQVLATEQYSQKLRVDITPRKAAGGAVEPNPFSLSITPLSVSDGPIEGHLYASSARIFTFNGRSVLVFYWAIENTADGFEAALVNNHFSENLAKDRVVAKLGGPGGSRKAFRMHDASIGSGLQCRMQATATGRQLVVKVTGYAFVPGQAIIQFKTRIDSRRR